MSEGLIHICFSRKDMESRRIQFCPTCKKRRRFYGWFQEWYGWEITCLGCGDRWQDGELAERPFRPRWRQENIAEAKKCWKRLTTQQEGSR